MSQLLGYGLISLPFVFLFVWILCEDGWRAVLFTFGVASLIITVISLGAYLITK